jgi:hypothetical protein
LTGPILLGAAGVPDGPIQITARTHHRIAAGLSPAETAKKPTVSTNQMVQTLLHRTARQKLPSAPKPRNIRAAALSGFWVDTKSWQRDNICCHLLPFMPNSFGTVLMLLF